MNRWTYCNLEITNENLEPWENKNEDTKTEFSNSNIVFFGRYGIDDISFYIDSSEEFPYEVSDFLYDSGREDRIFGRD